VTQQQEEPFSFFTTQKCYRLVEIASNIVVATSKEIPQSKPMFSEEFSYAILNSNYYYYSTKAPSRSYRRRARNRGFESQQTYF
jgi:hypothetical protein